MKKKSARENQRLENDFDPNSDPNTSVTLDQLSQGTGGPEADNEANQSGGSHEEIK